MSKRNKKNSAIAYGFLTPWLIGFFGLVLGPMIVSLYLSFTQYNLLTAPHWVGFSNYKTMFQDDPNFWSSVRVTAVYCVLSVPTQLLAALLVALLLKKGIKGIRIYRTVYYLPSLLGGSVAIAILWQNIFNSDGIFNRFLGLFGIKGQAWISNPDYAIYTLVLLSIWQFGASMIIFLAGLKQIPEDLYEAAQIDGANRFHQFRAITLPMLSPVIFFNLVMEVIKSLQSFTSAYIISGGTGGPVNSTLFYTLYLYQNGFGYFKMGYAAAMAWLLLIVLAVITGFLFLTSRYWVHYEDGGIR
ncbi:sugar ABC transporter permease [Pullulanibacillus sp. KACC 23026]|uniref:carbohydrate ABC transporter permease n=1 Tax=Pullulanibacillus sp. KACC 23026 TaxID=3028315 RepID=UPI0023B166EF|nr:sugar ABC transporter permease [Pullulanibacillus sp. KACC 23026]WEG13495.1 sugar ABC transporter permease [Pullulanibacillus sp. KACC 23026]